MKTNRKPKVEIRIIELPTDNRSIERLKHPPEGELVDDRESALKWIAGKSSNRRFQIVEVIYGGVEPGGVSGRMMPD